MKRSPLTAREKLLNVAFKMVAHQGYAGASVQQIAGRAGTTKPTLYYYFGSKAGLYQALIDQAYDERLALIQAAAAPHKTCNEQLVAIFDAMLKFARDRRELMRICFATAFATSGEIPQSIRYSEKASLQLQFVNDIIEQGLKTGELDSRFDSMELATAIYGQFVIHAMAQVVRSAKCFPSPAARRLVQLFMEGAASKPTRSGKGGRKS